MTEQDLHEELKALAKKYAEEGIVLKDVDFVWGSTVSGAFYLICIEVKTESWS